MSLTWIREISERGRVTRGGVGVGVKRETGKNRGVRNRGSKKHNVES